MLWTSKLGRHAVQNVEPAFVVPERQVRPCSRRRLLKLQRGPISQIDARPEMEEVVQQAFISGAGAAHDGGQLGRVPPFLASAPDGTSPGKL